MLFLNILLTDTKKLQSNFGKADWFIPPKILPSKFSKFLLLLMHLELPDNYEIHIHNIHNIHGRCEILIQLI